MNQHDTEVAPIEPLLWTKEQQPLQMTLTWRSIKVIFGFRLMLQAPREGQSCIGRGANAKPLMQKFSCKEAVARHIKKRRRRGAGSVRGYV